jgi:hypothetical protein
MMTLPPVIGLNGFASAGKDETFAALAVLGYERVSVADVIRRAAEALDPIVAYDGDLLRISDLLRRAPGATWGDRWQHIKMTYPEVRRTLLLLGTEVGRDIIDPDVWVKIAHRDLPPLAVFTDCRFLNEARAAVAGGGQVWLITRPGVGPVTDHPSETELIDNDWPFDVRIDNDGTVADLHAKARAAVGVPILSPVNA